MSISQINSSGSTVQLYGFPNYNKPISDSKNTDGMLQNDNMFKSIDIVSGVAQKYDVKNITPREMAQMSQELYDNNSISLKNHAFISFQPELNPSYNNTIGKFTHTTAQPDNPRNFLNEWKERLEEQLKDGASTEIINNTKEVVSILDNLDRLRETLLT